jgi:hypothetical protein
VRLVEEDIRKGKERISLKKALLIALSILSTPNSYRSVGRQFGVPKSTVLFSLQKIFLINTFLCPKFIKWPSVEEQNDRHNHNFFRKEGFSTGSGSHRWVPYTH